jgi:DNA-binding NtrC family response regulator
VLLLTVPKPKTLRKTILVVDDEQDIREAVRDVLESSLEDSRILTADSGAEALHILELEPVDLIITDHRMPGMTGVQLLGAADKMAPAVKHLLITAFDRQLASDLSELGKAERFLQKPLDPERLLYEVERALSD